MDSAAKCPNCTAIAHAVPAIDIFSAILMSINVCILYIQIKESLIIQCLRKQTCQHKPLAVTSFCFCQFFSRYMLNKTKRQRNLKIKTILGKKQWFKNEIYINSLDCTITISMMKSLRIGKYCYFLCAIFIDRYIKYI